MALDANDIKLLTTALTAAIRQSGGQGQRWEATASRVRDDTGSPEDRANNIRSAKNLQDANKIQKELANMLANNTRSHADLQRFTDVNNKVMIKAIDAYGDIEDSTKALTKQLQRQLASQDAATQKIQKLAGGMKTLADALSFADLGKHMTELSKSLDASSDASADEIVHAVEQLEKTIKRNGGNGVQDVSAELKAFTDEIARISKLTRVAVQQDVAEGRAAAVGDRIRDDAEIKKQTEAARKRANNIAAQEQLRDLAIQSQTKSIEASTIATKKSTSIVGTANKRLSDWTTKVASAAFVLDALVKAGKQLYTTMKTAGGTGTERGFLNVMGRDVSSLLHGLSPDTIQEIQVKGARTRSSMGRADFDKSIHEGTSNLWGVTYDRDQAAKMQEMNLSVLNRSGIRSQQAQDAAASKALRDSFVKLQYLTGLTGEQMAGLTVEIAADKDFRQGLMTLSEKERAATVTGITAMFQENALRNISIEQSKAMYKAQQDMANAHSPRSRIKNAAKLRAMGGFMGVDTGDAADLLLASNNGELMKKQLMKRNPGMTEEQANARVKNANETFKTIGTSNELALSDNGALGLGREALLGKMPELKSLGDGTFGQTLNIAGQMQKDAADKMMEAAIAMGGGSHVVNGIDYVINGLKTITGGLLAAVALYAGFKFLGPALMTKVMPKIGGTIAKVAPGLANKIGIQAATKATNTIATAGAGAAAGGAAAAGAAGGSIPRIVPVGGTMSTIGGMGAAANAGGVTAGGVVPKVVPVGGTMSTISGMGAAANAVKPSLWSRGLSALGMVAKPVAVVGAGIGAIDALADDTKSTKEKTAGVTGAVAGGVGGWYGAGAGAGYGAALGTAIFPGVGTAIGAGIGGLAGGIAGAWAGDKVGSAVGGGAAGLFTSGPELGVVKSPVPIGRPVTPVAPSYDPKVNTMNPMISTTPVAAPTQLTPQQEADLRQTTAMTQMNVTLASILSVLQTQTENMSADSDKNIEMQKRIQRVMKNNNFAGAVPSDGAAGAYNN